MNEFEVGDKVRFKDSKANYRYWKNHYSRSFGFEDAVTVAWVDGSFINPKECRQGLSVFAYRFERVVDSGDQLQLPFKGRF